LVQFKALTTTKLFIDLLKCVDCDLAVLRVTRWKHSEGVCNTAWRITFTRITALLYYTAEQPIGKLKLFSMISCMHLVFMFQTPFRIIDSLAEKFIKCFNQG